MELYRVITENKNYQDIIEYLKNNKFDATIIQANDLRQGKIGKSIVIEMTIPNCVCINSGVESFVYWLKKYNKQDKVMLQIIDADIKLL